MKTISCIVVLVVALFVLWRVFDKDGRVAQAVENTMESATLTAEERSLPPKGDTTRNAIIRKAMLEQRERDNREWTAANRKAHSDLYLEHCGKMLVNYLDQYDAAILEVKTTINLYKLEIGDARESSSSMLGFLKEAKKAIEDEKLVYPAKVGIFTYPDSVKLKEAVFATDTKLSENEKTIQAKTAQIEQMQESMSELKKGRDRVKTELGELDRIKAQVKTDMLLKSVEALGARMNDLLSGVDTIANGLEAKPGRVKQTTEKSVNDVFSRRGIE